jgi:hypothetical protein
MWGVVPEVRMVNMWGVVPEVGMVQDGELYRKWGLYKCGELYRKWALCKCEEVPEAGMVQMWGVVQELYGKVTNVGSFTGSKDGANVGSCTRSGMIQKVGSRVPEVGFTESGKM